MSINARIAAITAEHAAARSAAGVTGRQSIRADGWRAVTRLAAEVATRAERERDARRLTERERHAEASRLARRLRMVQDARNEAEASGQDERSARLSLLIGDIESARDRYMHATFAVPTVEEDWAAGGRFARRARGFDLGFIGYTAEDIMQDAAELLTLAGLMSDDMWPTLGEGYAAIKRAYRRGLGFYGYERRGKVVERDKSAQGYRVEDSFTLECVRMRARDDAATVASLMRGASLMDTERDDREAERIVEVYPVAERRRRALQTLTNRFPLNADGRMLALATLLTEGYTIEELTEGLGVTERTLFSWAEQLQTIGA